MSSETQAPKGNATDGIDICGDGSILKEILVEGTGDETPVNGVKTKVHYVGTLLDGSKFDSSRDRGTPFEFTIGEGVITGWSEGVATMKLGEKSMFTIASHKAYGEHGSPPKIPGGATLQFEIELLSFSSYDDIATGVQMKKTVKTGEKWTTPAELAEIKFHMIIKVHNEQVYSSRDGPELEAVIGDEDVVSGVELGLKKMNRGEEAILRIKPEYGFGAKGSDEFHVPANTGFEAIVELVYVKNPASLYELKEAEESLCHVRSLKEVGNAKFKAQRYAAATQRYSTALKFLDAIDGEATAEQKTEIEALTVSLRLNHAATLIKAAKYEQAREECAKVLKTDPSNVKATFRTAQAWLEQKEFVEATAAFKKCLALDSNNAQAKSCLQKAVQGKKAQEAVEKKMFSKMFG